MDVDKNSLCLKQIVEEHVNFCWLPLTRLQGAAAVRTAIQQHFPV